jgi:hypothetical protein
MLYLPKRNIKTILGSTANPSRTKLLVPSKCYQCSKLASYRQLQKVARQMRAIIQGCQYGRNACFNHTEIFAQQTKPQSDCAALGKSGEQLATAMAA